MLSQTSRAIARKMAQTAVDRTIVHYPAVALIELARTAPRDDQPSATPPFVYEGPFAKTVTNLKRLSIASCAATTLLSPLLVALAYDDGSTVATKAAVAATVCSFGLFTTGMLHWFTSPYVLRLVHVPGSDQVELETKTILGGTVKTTVHMPGDIKPANTMQPLSTFEAKGRVFYLDADNFANKALLHRLTPEEPNNTETLK